MDDTEYILITDFCEYHDIQYSFIHSLNDFGLVEIKVIEENEYLNPEQVKELETMMRLHYDLEINLQGIDAIRNLLNRVANLQDEVRLLRNRLSRYED